ncbi:unnamed protein product, partial [Musa hybrid cultivar]
MAMAAALVVFLLAAGVGRSESAVYKVGDAVYNMVTGMQKIDHPAKLCEVCVMGKQKRKPFKVRKIKRACNRLNLVHSDVCGPINLVSLGGSRYFLTFTDDHSISTPAAAPRSSSGPRCVAKVFVIGLAVFSFAAVCLVAFGSSGRSIATPPVEVAVMVPATEGSGMVRRRADAPLRRRRPRRSRLRCRRRRRMAPLPPHGVAAGNQGMTHASLPVAVHEKEKERE